MVKRGRKFEISSWRGARVDVRTYLLGGAIDGSEANGIIRDPKLELESSRFTFDLVPLSYESVDVVVGENWLLRHKAEMVCHEKVVKMPCVPKELVGFTPRRRMGFRMELVQGATPICEGSCHLTSLERQEVWNDYRNCKVRVGLNGNLLWKASGEDVREVLQNRGRKQRGSYLDVEGIQMGNENDLGIAGRSRRFRSDPILAMLRTSMVDFRGNWNSQFVKMSFFPKVGLSLSMDVLHLWHGFGKECWLRFMAVNGECELNDQFGTRNQPNKIVVIQERLEAAKLSKELAW
ncbi:hypothetical protein Tco_0462747 [Tanacetum coccineum]